VLKLGYKFKAFVRLLDVRTKGIDEEILEGQTSAGKTTVGMGLKLILLASLSPKKLHLLCGSNLGKVEDNIISKDNGILDIAQSYGFKVDYFPDDKVEEFVKQLNQSKGGIDAEKERAASEPSDAEN
jgi:hypothetical protein